MANTPWLTSDSLIECVKRKFAIPISQNTFSEDDILSFANEEMAIAQVPSVLIYHQEYFVTSKTVAIEENKSRYEIPERAIGGKLRDIFWSDINGNLFEMTRISSEDKSFFQRTSGGNQSVSKFYLEGNDVVLTPSIITNPTGFLVFYYFLRPNQLVTNDRAAIITYFNSNITIDNTTLVNGDTITVADEIFTAVTGSPSTNEFQIGATSIITATNLVTAVNTNGVAVASNGSPSTTMIKLQFINLVDSQDIQTSNSVAFAIASGQAIEFDSMPSNITSTLLVDFLQTKSGHRTKALDIQIPSNSISTNQITFTLADIPNTLVVGDYICLANECIIPQIPTDLHNGLAERTGSRMLAAMGDQAGLQVSNAKILENEKNQGTLLDQRVEGSCQKINARHSILRYSKMGSRGRP